MNNEVFQDKFMYLITPATTERFVPILKDERLLIRFHTVSNRGTNNVQDVVFLSTNSLNVGDKFEITIPEIITHSDFRHIHICLCGFVDIDILGRKVELDAFQSQRFVMSIISKEQLLEKIGDQINFSVSNTIQKYPSIVRKIA